MRYLKIRVTPALAFIVRSWAEAEHPGWFADRSIAPLPPHDERGHWEVALKRGSKGRIVGVDHSRVKRTPAYRASLKKTARDAENPVPGEKFQSKRGDVWEIVSQQGNLIKVKKVGFKDTGVLIWSKGTLRHMKPERPAISFLEGLLPGTPKNINAGDPGRRRAGVSHLQSITFDKRLFTPARAKDWLARRGHRHVLDTSSTQIRARQKAPGQFKRFWTLRIGRGVNFVMGVK